MLKDELVEKTSTSAQRASSGTQGKKQTKKTQHNKQTNNKKQQRETDNSEGLQRCCEVMQGGI